METEMVLGERLREIQQLKWKINRMQAHYEH